MRDDSYLTSEVEADEATSKWRARAATAVGALVSVALLIGVVIWSYRLGVRDAAEIPVIRAELGATKQKPEEPGGLEVDYQDRAVYGVLTGEDGAEGGTALADAPEALTREDIAPIERAPVPAPRPSVEEAASVPAPAPTSPEPVAETPPAPDPAPQSAAAVVEEAAPAPGSPASGESEATEIAALVEDALAEDGLAEDGLTEDGLTEDAGSNGLAPVSAPIARPRPARAAPQPAVASAAEAPEPRAAALASRIQIQLGAFVSQEVAEAQWAAIKARNGDLLAGRGRVITPVLSGGRRLFRLRAGPFENVDEASGLCRGLKARNEACIVARSEN